MSLLAKGAEETVSPAQSESGFYSRYFLIPRRMVSKTHPRSHTSELRPYETAVRDDYIETDSLANMPRGLVLFAGSERHLLSHPDSPPPQAVLEIRLRACGLSIHGPSLWAVPGSPHFFMKCMDAALSPLRQLVFRILNYIDDWLILAQSEDALLSHRSVLLRHLECLGLRVNFAKSVLSPSQRILFLGAVIDSARIRAVVTQERALAI